jgi:hypothetical protein
MTTKRLALFCLVLAGCGMPMILADGGLLNGDDAGNQMMGGEDGGVDAGSDAGAQVADAGMDAGADAGTMPDGGGVSCPPGITCVTTFPFSDMNDTSNAALPSMLNMYSCSASTNEGGREAIYRVEVPFDGFLSAAVDEASGVDVDVHILSALDASQCLSRGNFHAKADVTAGTYWVVVDTFVSGGVPQAGAFRVDIGFTRPSSGACDLQTGVMPRVNDMGNSLPMPATGQMAVEAHLVTQDEPPPYPMTQTEELAAHYLLSQARTGFVMHRTQVWAPLEGGTFYGAGIGSPTLFPLEHEGWYVNMYWTSAARPARGTRMILRMPNTNRAVVVAAGYETGPGNLSFIGGTPEETHFYFGTTHGSVMQLGLAVDQSLPLGPRTCSP